MTGRSRRLALLIVVVVLALAPGVVTAHGVTTSRFDAPVPLWLLLVGAGATVAATAGLVAVADRSPSTRSNRHHRDRPSQERRWHSDLSPRFASGTRNGLAALALVTLLGVLLAGIWGRQVAAENFASVVTWPLTLHGLALVAIAIGDPWPVLSPWRSIHAGLSWLEGRQLSVRSGMPSVLSSWPAVVGFLCLYGVVENLTVIPRSPRLTAVLVAAYGGAMVLGSVAVGAEWLRRADPLGVFFGLLGRLSPITASRAADGAGTNVSLRWPWAGCRRPVADDSLVVFVVAMVYTVSFDGASDLAVFRTLTFAVRGALGTGPQTTVLVYLAGLLAFLAVFWLACWLVECLGAGNGADWRETARWFVPTFLPIAAAYEVAHVYPYVLENLGELPAIVLVPLGGGAVDPLAPLSLPAFWASQVGLVVLGHVVAVIAAHHVARDRFGDARAARRGHLPLVALMVGYTGLSLWIVSAPVVAA